MEKETDTGMGVGAFSRGCTKFVMSDCFAPTKLHIKINFTTYIYSYYFQYSIKINIIPVTIFIFIIHLVTRFKNIYIYFINFI